MIQTTKTTDRSKRSKRSKRSQRGMVTAEYAVGVVFACGLAGGCLIPALTSPLMRNALEMLWRFALEPWW